MLSRDSNNSNNPATCTIYVPSSSVSANHLTRKWETSAIQKYVASELVAEASSKTPTVAIDSNARVYFSSCLSAICRAFLSTACSPLPNSPPFWYVHNLVTTRNLPQFYWLADSLPLDALVPVGKCSCWYDRPRLLPSFRYCQSSAPSEHLYRTNYWIPAQSSNAQVCIVVKLLYAKKMMLDSIERLLFCFLLHCTVHGICEDCIEELG